MIVDEKEANEAIARLLAGEREQLAPLLQYFRPRLHAMIRLRAGRLAKRVDGSDILQDLFVEADRRVERYVDSPRVSFHVWLRTLMRDLIYKSKRRHLWTGIRSMQREIELPAEGSAALALQLVSLESPSRVVMREELREAVRAAILTLSVADQEVVLMRHFEWMSNSEVAQTLGISDSAATMRHGRAIVRLKASLQTHLDLSSNGESEEAK